MATGRKGSDGSCHIRLLQEWKGWKVKSFFSSQFEEDEIPVSELFRTYEHMPLLEQTALDMAQGKILDVGAGSGCHSLALKQMGKKVCGY